MTKQRWLSISLQLLEDYVKNVSLVDYSSTPAASLFLAIKYITNLVSPSILPRAGDGKCVICDSYVRPATLVRVCDECNYGSYAGRCVICGGIGVSDAYYCKECTIQEKDVSYFEDIIGHLGIVFSLSCLIKQLI